MASNSFKIKTLSLFIPLFLATNLLAQDEDVVHSKEAQEAYKKIKEQKIMYARLKVAAENDQCNSGTKEQKLACLVIQSELKNKTPKSAPKQVQKSSTSKYDMSAILGFDPNSKPADVALGVDPTLRRSMTQLKSKDKKKYEAYFDLFSSGRCHILGHKEFKLCKEVEMYEISKAAVANECGFFKSVKSLSQYCSKQREKFVKEGYTDSLDVDMILSNPDRKVGHFKKLNQMANRVCDLENTQSKKKECLDHLKSKDRNLEYQLKCESCMGDKEHIDVCKIPLDKDYVRERNIRLYAFYGQCDKLEVEMDNNECMQVYNRIVFDNITVGCKDMVTSKMYYECLNFREKASMPDEGPRDPTPKLLQEPPALRRDRSIDPEV